MNKYLSMRKKMVIYLIAIVILTLLPFSFIRYFAKDGIQQLFSYRSELKSDRILQKLGWSINKAQVLADRLAFFFGATQSGSQKHLLSYNVNSSGLKDALKDMIRETVMVSAFDGKESENVAVYGSTIAFVPGAIDKLGAFSPYFCKARKNGNAGIEQLRYKDLADESYDYTQWDWFKVPVKTKKPYWSEPYIDSDGGGIMMVTYSVPAIAKDKVIAVITVDIAIETIQTVLKQGNAEENPEGYCFFLTKGKKAIGSRSHWQRLSNVNGIVDLVETDSYAKAHKDVFMKKYLEYMLNALSTFEQVETKYGTSNYNKFIKEFRLHFPEMRESIYDPDLKTMTRYYFTPVEFLDGLIFVIATPESVLAESIRQLQINLAFMILGIFVFVSPFVIVLSGLAANPAKKLKAQADKFASGDFDYRVPEENLSFAQNLFSGTSHEMAVVSDALNQLGGQLKKSFGEIEKTKKEILHRLTLASEYRDRDTSLHVERVSSYAEIIAKKLGFSDNECEIFKDAASMHDVGKIGVPDNILLKQGKLTGDEFEIMKTHTTIGMKILSGSDTTLLQMAEKVAGSHHEKWDGTGYPQGLSGENIPIEGRIVMICDIFDALTSRRPYKDAWTCGEALDYIKSESGKFFDPALVKVFVGSFDEIKEIRERLS